MGSTAAWRSPGDDPGPLRPAARNLGPRFSARPPARSRRRSDGAATADRDRAAGLAAAQALFQRLHCRVDPHPGRGARLAWLERKKEERFRFLEVLALDP